MTPSIPGAGAIGDPGLSGAFRIDREGTWRHEGIEVTHPGVLQNLYANLRVDGEGHHLQAGPLRVPVHVDDTPFVVVRAESEADPRTVVLHLSDGSQEPLDPATLVLDGRGTPYCWVKRGRFRARLAVAAWLQLAQRIETATETSPPALVLGDRQFPLIRNV